ncbi:hypothetical protein CA85_12290 [Allorhodopirellula solitaria]|uniref:Uncharacterized protein n=1 Tax=Allorhodopirellula solitaria TaxID=2527987 RepID=A0A5C5YHM1_9BACT|nr:hypothetical protein CA85_12290 [Allorhodopirellula solitaria]
MQVTPHFSGRCERLLDVHSITPRSVIRTQSTPRNVRVRCSANQDDESLFPCLPNRVQRDRVDSDHVACDGQFVRAGDADD